MDPITPSQQGGKPQGEEAEFMLGQVWKDLLMRISDLRFHFRKMLYAGIAVALLAAGYAFIKKPVYLARVSFVIEENKQNAGGLFSALAGQIGMDLSSLSGISGVLAGDNVLELLKSPTLLKKVLLSPLPNDSSQSIAYAYARANGKLEQYQKKIGKELIFEAVEPTSAIVVQGLGSMGGRNSEAAPSGVSVLSEPSRNAKTSGNTNAILLSKRVEDSLLTALVTRITEKELSVYKPDRKLSVFRLELQTRDEVLSQLISMRLIKQAADFYIETKTRRLRINVERLQRKSDSISALLNNRTVSTATKDFINQNPSFINTEVDLEISNREKTMLSIIYSDLNKSLDLTRTALIQETPTIEIIDTPDLPLKKEEVEYLVAVPVGFVLGCLGFALLVVFGKRRR